jgi:hypothetical protein
MVMRRVPTWAWVVLVVILIAIAYLLVGSNVTVSSGADLP